MAQADTLVLKNVKQDSYVLVKTGKGLYEFELTSTGSKVIARVIHPADSFFNYKALFSSLDTLIKLPPLYCGSGVTYVPVLLDSTASVLALGKVQFVGDHDLADSIEAALFSMDMGAYVSTPIQGYWLLRAQVNISRRPAREYVAP